MKKEEALKSFEEEYRALANTVKGGRDKVKQGELYKKYLDAGLTEKDIFSIIKEVDGKDIKDESVKRRFNDSLKQYQESQMPTIVSEEVLPTKDLSELTVEEIISEIRAREYNINQNMLAIGMFLKEAKKKVAHGEWDNWLKENTSITRKTAAKLMQCVDRFANDALARQLEISKMEELLSLPKGTTQEFFESCEDKGQPVQNMTKQELRAEIKDWKRHKGDVSSEVTLEVETEEESSATAIAETTVVTESVEIETQKLPEYTEFTLKISKGEEKLLQELLMTALEQDKTLSEISREYLLDSITNIA